MKLIRKHAAALTAFLLLAGCVTERLPAFTGTAGDLSPLLRFAEQAEMLTVRQDDAFAVLQFDPASQEILLDGESAGSEAGGFAVVDGKLMLDAAAAGVEDPDTPYLSLEAAQETIGCEVYECGGKTVVTSPFRNGTLIVAADGEIGSEGASAECSGYGGLHVLQYDSAAEAYQAYLAYSQQENVQFAEPNRIVRAAEFDDSDGRGGNWGYLAIGADAFQELYLPEAGHAVKVAVIDTGLYADHSFFKNRIAEGGASFVAENEGSTDDDFGHGTHCAGIITCQTGENVKILPIKALDHQGYGDTLGIYCAMMYALEQKADIVSMSLGGTGKSPLMEKAAAAMNAAGVVCVCAAGNESIDSYFIHPGYIDSVVTVSCLDQINEGFELADFSNYGDNIDFCAPGCDIESADTFDPNATTLKSGTSMATPMVAACYANLLSVDDGLSLEQMYDYLRANALDLGEAGHDSIFGWGMVQLRDFAFYDGQCAMPEASLKGGMYHRPFEISLASDTEGAEIYYTTDGSVPDREHGELYDGILIPVSQTTDLRAIAFKGDSGSRMLHENYVLEADLPASVPAAGLYDDAVDVTLSADIGAQILYTTDGSDPIDGNAKLYAGEKIHIAETTLIRAVADFGTLHSREMRASYVIDNTGYEKLILVEDGVLTSYAGSLQTLDLPALLPDTKITAIGEGAFADNWDIETVILPDTVTAIGDHAFDCCWSLKSVTGDGVVSVGQEAFSFNTSLAEVHFPKLRVIGARAFANCMQQWDAFWDWSAVTEIGDEAFLSAGVAASPELNALKKIGSGAFSLTSHIESIILPESITEIPARLCYHSNVQQIWAMGAVRIGDEAFSRDIEQYVKELALPYDRIKSVGARAFERISFADRSERILSFDALETIGEGAFSDTECNVLLLPALKTIPQNGLEMIAAQMVYLEAVETMAEQSVSFYSYKESGLVIGSHLKAYSGYEISSPQRAAVIAAPADSPLGKYCAARNSFGYIATPDVYVGAVPDTIQQNEQTKLYAYPLGFGLTVKWSSETETACLQPDAYTFVPDASESGITTYQVVCCDENGPVCEPRTVMIETRAVSRSEEKLLCNQPFLFHYTGNDPVTIRYEFTADHDGDYYIYSEYGDADVKYQREGEQAVNQPGNGYVFDMLEPVRLNKDETVAVFVTAYYGPCNAILLAADRKPVYDLSQSYVSIEKWMFSSDEEITADALGASVGNCTYGTDYEILISREESRYYICGIGEYSGVYEDSLVIYEPYPETMPADLTLLGGKNKCFRFIPEHSGIYSFALDLTDEAFAALTENQSPESNWDNLCVSMTLHNDYFGNEYNLNERYGAFPLLECDLQANSVYFLTIEADTVMPPLKLYGKYGIFENSIVNADILLDYPEDGSYPFRPVELNAEVYAGETLLTEGKDYVKLCIDNELPGSMSLILRGIGDYFGVYRNDCACYLNAAKIPDLVYLDTEKPFEQTEQLGVYRFELQKTQILQFGTDADIRWKAQIYEYDPVEPVMEYFRPMDNYKINNQLLEYQPGTYYLLLWKYTEEPVTFRFEPYSGAADIETAVITAEPLAYTGKPLLPKLTVKMQDKLLREGIDYYISEHPPIIACGTYTLRLTGIGRYYGYANTEVTVAPDSSIELPLLRDGSNTAEIREAGETQLYRWIPSHSSYCFRKDFLENAEISVVDRFGREVGLVSGAGYQYLEMNVTLRGEYYVKVRFFDAKKTGSIPFFAVPEPKMLERCMIVGAKIVFGTDIEGDLPRFDVTDGDAVLENGRDYEIYWQGAAGMYGYGEAVLHGIGDYCGTLTYSYIVVPDYEDMLDGPEAQTLYLNETQTEVRNGIGGWKRFVFTALSDGQYYLTLPSSDFCGVSAVVYLQDRSILPDGQKMVSLKKGDVLQILCLSDWLESDFSDTESFFVGVSQSPGTLIYEENGFEYIFDEGAALLMRVPEGVSGICLPDPVFDEINDITGSFDGLYSRELMDYLAENCTIYCHKNDNVMYYCKQFGLCYALLDAECTVQGDVTGDGIVDRNDVLTLMRWLQEGEGMILSESAAAMADLDADGTVTMLDLRLLRGMAA